MTCSLETGPVIIRVRRSGKRILGQKKRHAPDRLARKLREVDTSWIGPDRLAVVGYGLDELLFDLNT